MSGMNDQRPPSLYELDAQRREAEQRRVLQVVEERTPTITIKGVERKLTAVEYAGLRARLDRGMTERFAGAWDDRNRTTSLELPSPWNQATGDDMRAAALGYVRGLIDRRSLNHLASRALNGGDVVASARSAVLDAARDAYAALDLVRLARVLRVANAEGLIGDVRSPSWRRGREVLMRAGLWPAHLDEPREGASGGGVAVV